MKHDAGRQVVFVKQNLGKFGERFGSCCTVTMESEEVVPEAEQNAMDDAATRARRIREP